MPTVLHRNAREKRFFGSQRQSMPFSPRPSIAAVRAAVIGVPLVCSSALSQAQQIFEVTGPDNPPLELFADNLPSGATINVREGAGLQELFIFPYADPADQENAPPFAINVDGTVGSVTLDTGNFDVNTFVPLSNLNISSTGVVSSLGLNGGATLTNEGVISLANADGGNVAAPVFLADRGSNSIYTFTNRGTISQSGENRADGVFGDTIVAFGGFGPDPASISLDLNNEGTIRLGPDATGFLLRWRDADEIRVQNSGVLDAGFTVSAAGFEQASVLLTRDRSGGAGLEFDDIISVVNETTGEMRGARIFANFGFDVTGYDLNFVNDGTIFASGSSSANTPSASAWETFSRTTFTNTGSIRIDGTLLESGDGIGSFLFHAVTPETEYSQAVFDQQALDLTNEASGLIDADGTGIQFQSGTVVNDGTLIARSEDFGVGIIAGVGLQNLPREFWNESVDVTNSGIIQAGFIGVSKRAGVENMNLTNSGTIETLDPSVFGPVAIELTEGSMSVTNTETGVIRGQRAIFATNGRMTLTNDGLIEGDVVLGAGNDTVTAGGTFDGQVRLGDGDDTFIARGGLRVTNSVLGGAGFDTLRFVDTGFTTAPGGISAFFDEFDEVFVEGNFSLGGDGRASEIEFFGVPVEFEEGAEFTIDAFEDGTNDVFRNTGPIILNGGLVRALSPDGAWSVAQDYTILQSDTSVTGTFDRAISNLEYLDASLSYTADSVILSLERVDGLIQGDILETANAQQLSVAVRVVPQIIQTQISNSINALLNSSSAGSAVVAAPVSFGTGLSAGDETGEADGATGSAWVNITPTRYDQRAVLPGTQGLQKIDGDTVNFLVGVDRIAGSRFVMGAFAGYEDSEVNYQAIRGAQESDGFLIGAYGGVAFNSWLYSSINFNWAQLDTRLEERAFDAPEVQEASFDSERLSVGLDLTASMQRGKMNYLAQIAYNYSDETYDAYRTNRGELVQLKDLALSRFGLTGEVSYQGEQWSPYFSATYEVDTDVSDTVTDDTGLLINAGLRAVRGERLTLEAYIATVTSRSNENQELLGLNINYAF